MMKKNNTTVVFLILTLFPSCSFLNVEQEQQQSLNLMRQHELEITKTDSGYVVYNYSS